MAWIERNGEWMGHRRKRPAVHAPEPAQPSRCIEYRPMRCPICQSEHIPYYSKRDRIRYHICKNCGARFKSVEASAE